MHIQVLFFGQLADITGTDKLDAQDVKDTDALLVQLRQLHPALTDAAYLVAVDKEVINGNTMLHTGTTVALLPPFSGG